MECRSISGTNQGVTKMIMKRMQKENNDDVISKMIDHFLFQSKSLFFPKIKQKNTNIAYKYENILGILSHK